MMEKVFTKTKFAILALFCIIILSGCSPKNITYFQDLKDSGSYIENATNKQITIKPHDKLSILVNSKDGALASIFNLQTISSNSEMVNANNASENRGYNVKSSISAYTVDSEGNINFPVLGKLHIEGMTRSELAGFIRGEIMGRQLLKDPTVIVEFLNTGISVLGEVQKPGRFDLNRDNISILDALALAGDLTIQGKRENIKVIREENGQRKVYVIDLTKGNEALNSPAFYLHQDDVVYVEPNEVRKRQATANGNVALQASFWVSVASLLTTIAVLIFK